MKALDLANEIAKVLSDKKADNVLKINVSEKTSVADYFIVASGKSSTHVKALCDNVEEYFDKKDIAPLRREGVREGRWAVLDYGDVVVHIFNDENRDFYHLERLWDEGNNVERIDD